MVDVTELETMTEEERLVAELCSLGIRYLSRQTAHQPAGARAPEALLADLMQQPSARVRAATIALLLAHPEFGNAVPGALEQLTAEERFNLRAFYMAAVFLQQEHEDRLRILRSGQWRRLPVLVPIVADLDLPDSGTPREKLLALGREHRRRGSRAKRAITLRSQAGRGDQALVASASAAAASAIATALRPLASVTTRSWDGLRMAAIWSARRARTPPA